MDRLGLTEEEYFSLTEKERIEIARDVLHLMRKDKDLLAPDMFDDMIIPVLNTELKQAINLENYMMCEAIRTMLKVIENEKTL
jgi:hypothetical protein